MHMKLPQIAESPWFHWLFYGGIYLGCTTQKKPKLNQRFIVGFFLFGCVVVWTSYPLFTEPERQGNALNAVGVHSANLLAESCVIWRVVRQIADNLLPSISAFMRLSFPHSTPFALKYGKLKDCQYKVFPQFTTLRMENCGFSFFTATAFIINSPCRVYRATINDYANGAEGRAPDTRELCNVGGRVCTEISSPSSQIPLPQPKRAIKKI